MPDQPTDMLPPMLLADYEPLDATALAAQMQDAANAALAETLGAPATPVVLWTPTDMGEAEWAMAHVRACHRQISAAQEQARLWRLQIDAWEEAQTAGPTRRAQFFDGALVRYAAMQTMRLALLT